MKPENESQLPRRTGYLPEFLLYVVPVLILAGFMAWWGAKHIGRAPPSRITITTGSATGAYFAYAQTYRKILKRSGIDLIVRPSNGTVENLARLRDKGSRVDIALVQGGIADPQDVADLQSLGRMFYEPLWVFYRAEQPLVSLAQLSRKRIAVGPEGSGTRQLAIALLTANGLGGEVAKLLPLSGDDAIGALRRGDADAAFVVAAPEAPVVQRLLRDPEVQLMSLPQSKAYVRIFPYLSKVELPQGVIDLSGNLPPEDVQMIAPVAALVTRKSLHPGLVSLLAEAAAEVHGKPGLFAGPGEFPKPADPVFEMSEDAVRFYRTGKPFLRRYLPFWVVAWIERLVVILIPLLTILLPLGRVLPMIYQWRMKRRIRNWYVVLKELESNYEHSPDAVARAGHLQELSRIDRRVKALRVPVEFDSDLYTLRMHIEMIRQRLQAAPHTVGQAGIHIVPSSKG